MFLVLVPQAIGFVILLVIYAALYDAEQNAARQKEAKSIIEKCQLINSQTFASLAAISQYAVSLKPSYLHTYQRLVGRTESDFSELDRLAQADPEFQAKIRHFRMIFERMLALMNGFGDAADSGNDRPSEFLQMASVQNLAGDLLKQFTAETEEVVEAYQKKTGEKIDDEQWRIKLKNIVVVATVVNVLLGLVLATAFSRSITSRLKILVENTLRLSQEKKLHVPVTGADEIAALDRVFHDMSTALVLSRQKERAVVENAVDVICSFDRELKFVAVNPAAEKIWGYAPDQLRNRSLSDLLGGSPGDTTITNLQKVMEEKSELTFKSSIHRQDGSTAWMLWSAQWSETEQILCCVAHDVTENEEIARLKQDFMNMVSHDLRSPLTSIRGAIALLQSGVFGALSDEGQITIDRTESEIERLISLVNDLLDQERFSSGKLTLDCALLRPTNLLNRARESVELLAAGKGISLVIEEEVSDRAFLGDGKRLVQVLINLLSNAIKFSPDNVSVRLGAITVGDQLEFEVIDLGPGIAPEQRTRVFEKFYQVRDADERARSKGSGLGLSICKAIVDAHGGSIGVEPGVNGGSRFWFRIPLSNSPVLARYESTLQAE